MRKGMTFGIAIGFALAIGLVITFGYKNNSSNEVEVSKDYLEVYYPGSENGYL